MRVVLAALLCLTGCSFRPVERLDTLFDAASREVRAGEPAKAQLIAERGMALAASRHDAVAEWNFRLLRWEILLQGGRAEEVINQVRAVMPAGPQFAGLRARRLRILAAPCV